MVWASSRGALSGLFALRVIQVRCCPRQCLGLESSNLAKLQINSRHTHARYPISQFHSKDGQHAGETIDALSNAIVYPSDQKCAGSIYHNRKLLEVFSHCGAPPCFPISSIPKSRLNCSFEDHTKANKALFYNDSAVFVGEIRRQFGHFLLESVQGLGFRV